MWFPMEQPSGHLRQPPSMEVVLSPESTIDSDSVQKVRETGQQNCRPTPSAVRIDIPAHISHGIDSKAFSTAWAS